MHEKAPPMLRHRCQWRLVFVCLGVHGPPPWKKDSQTARTIFSNCKKIKFYPIFWAFLNVCFSWCFVSFWVFSDAGQKSVFSKKKKSSQVHVIMHLFLQFSAGETQCYQAKHSSLFVQKFCCSCLRQWPENKAGPCVARGRSEHSVPR